MHYAAISSSFAASPLLFPFSCSLSHPVSFSFLSFSCFSHFSLVSFEVLTSDNIPHQAHREIQAEAAWCSTAESFLRDHTGKEGEKAASKYSQHAVTMTMAAQSLHPLNCHQTTSAQQGWWILKLISRDNTYLSVALIVEPDYCPFHRLYRRLSGCNYKDQKICRPQHNLL